MTDMTSAVSISGSQYALGADGPTGIAVPNMPTEPSPQDRLAASRARVRSALLEIAHPTPNAESSGPGGKLLRAMRHIPGAAIVLDTAKGWWQDHGQTARASSQASQALLSPLAKSYPGSMFGAAVGSGIVLILLKPWRWLFRPRFLVAVASLVATQAIKGRSTGAWLQTILDLYGQRAKRSI